MSKRKAIFVYEDGKVLERRPLITELINYRPYWNTREESKKINKQLKNKDRVTLYKIEDHKIIPFRTRFIERNVNHFSTKEEAQKELESFNKSFDYTITRGNISVFIDDKTHSMNASDKSFGKLKDACLESNYAKVMDILNLEIKLKNVGLDVGQKAKFLNEKINPDLTAKIIHAAKLDSSIINKFKDRLSKNPSKSAQTNLFEFLSKHGTTFVDDGRFIAYKYVASNFRDKHTGKFDYTPGKVVTMRRDEVEDNPKEACAPGLHVGSWGYVAGNGTLLLCVVDPYDVVSVPDDYNAAKMRTCKVTSVMQITDPITDKIISAKFIEENMGKLLA